MAAASEQFPFDEAGYLRLYPDIATAIASGTAFSALQHYLSHGRREGRRPNDVDAAFYLRAYPQAACDIAAGVAADAATHYLRLGRARGYRPNPVAPAADLPAMPPTHPFLWTDLPHALDLIEGRLRLGRLTERQAGLLRDWVQQGYVALDDPFDPRVRAAATLDLERCFAGACPDLLFSCGAVSLGPAPWQPDMLPYPAAALDIHYVSRPLRELVFSGSITELLGLLFDGPALLAHSRGMLREAAQAPQRDAAGVGYSLPRQWVSVLILLDDTDPAALCCFPRSHRAPDPIGRTLEQQLAELGIQAELVGGKPGRVIFRHPALAYKADPVPEDARRRTVSLQYCPSYAVPLYAERTGAKPWSHGSHNFMTQYYTGIDPLD